MNNILVTVGKHNVTKARATLIECLTAATYIGKGTYREIETAKYTLEKAKGIYETLERLDLFTIEEKGMVTSDISRIDEKIAATQRGKEAEAYARHMQRKS